MTYEMHQPQGILARYIENIVFYEGHTARHRADKLLPDGGVYLIINMLEKPGRLYKDEQLTSWKEYTGCFISGQHKGYIYLEADHSSNVAIRFKPGGAAPFFDFPVSRFNNKVQQVEPWLGPEITQLRKEIIEEKTVPAKFKMIEDFLLSKIKSSYHFNPVFHEVLEQMAKQPEIITVKQMAEKMKVSQKHLITLFDRQVGLTPKALLRIYRFQKVIMQLEKDGKVDWMQVVTDCGYYDQAHFIRDFYTFSGIRPGIYPHHKGEYVNYLPVKEAR